MLVLGDGINDAPAIAAGDLGAAMGLIGSDLTLQTADVVLRSSWLDRLPASVQLARTARRLVRTNLALALAAIGVLVGLDFAGHLPLMLGVAGHEDSTLLVALNGLRLLRSRHWPTPTTCTRPGAERGPGPAPSWQRPRRPELHKPGALPGHPTGGRLAEEIRPTRLPRAPGLPRMHRLGDDGGINGRTARPG